MFGSFWVKNPKMCMRISISRKETKIQTMKDKNAYLFLMFLRFNKVVDF